MKLFFIFCSILFSHNLNAQSANVAWADGFGNELDDYCTSVATNAYGNVYATGFFNGRVDFDPGPGVFYLTAGFYSNIFITKMDPAGNLIWAKQIGDGSCSANCIKLDMSGNIYITGDFSSTVDFDPGPDVYNLTAMGSNAFVSKYDSAGNFIWAKSFDAGPSSTGGTGMRLAIDSKGNVYTGGRFTVSFDFDPGPGVYNLTSGGDQDIFIDKLDSSGNFIWARSFGQSYDDQLLGISIDASDNVYTGGYFGYPIWNHAYFNKFDSYGNLLWSKNFTAASFISSMVADKNRIYMLGLYRNTAYFSRGLDTIDLISSGGYNSFVCRSDTAGNFIWAKSFGGDLNSMAKDSYGNIYTAGDSTSYDSGTYNINAYVNKLDTSGNFLWAKYMGGDLLNEALSIAVDNTGDIYLGGIFQGTANFDGIILHAVPAPADYPFPGDPMPTSDLFILKLIQIVNPIVWTGSISNSWGVAGNWDKNVIPDINSNVVIPSGLLIYPIVDTTTEIKSLYLQNGASLKVESNVKLKINGQ